MPEGHRFPVQKYAMLRQRLELDATTGTPFAFIEPHAATDEELRRVHCPQYLGRVFRGTLTRAEIQRIGFPWSQELVERSLRSTGAAIDAAGPLRLRGRCGSEPSWRHSSRRDELG